jgi:hypothetical protein
MAKIGDRIGKMWQTLPDSWKKGWWDVILNGGINIGALPSAGGKGEQEFAVLFTTKENMELIEGLLRAWNDVNGIPDMTRRP